MRAIVNTGPDKVEMLDVPVPEPGPGQVRIRTRACGICATDLEMIAGWNRTGFPAVPGHEWSGVVDAVGDDADTMLVGRHCVAENVLSDGGEVGFEHAGGYGEYLVTETRNVHPIPDAVSFTAASMVEPLAVCVRGMRRLRPEGMRSALILGDGPIGLLAVALLAKAGIENVVIVGGRAKRLAVASTFGASSTLNYHSLDSGLKSALRDLAPNGFDGIVEATGSESGMAVALDCVACKARVLVIGDYGSLRADFPWNSVLHRELEIVGSNASARAWPEAVRLAVCGAIPLDRLVTHRLPASRYEEGLDLVRGHGDNVIKVVLEW